MSSNFIGSETINKDDLSPTQKITDVYIGVFFDGTNNNMLWTAKKKIKKYRDKLNKKKQNNLSEDDKKYINNLSEDDVKIIINLHKKEYDRYLKDNSKNDEINSKKDFIKHKKYTKIDIETAIADRIVDNHTTLKDKNEWADFLKLQLSKEDKCRALKKGNHDNCKDCKNKSDDCVFLNNLNNTDDIIEWFIKNYKDKDAIRQYKNAHTTYKPTMCGGFSNIAILYSGYKPNPKEKNSKQYSIYIEGAGAVDLSHQISGNLLGNVNGLGFGLGETGVVALVSKAVYYVNNYIESIKSEFKELNKGEKINIHFNVFGFSRGASCSRLFSYLVTREKDDSLGKREKEFADFYAKGLYGVNGEKEKLHFLENENYNKTIDFLGIYDTVVSIGLLKQKDGWVNPARQAYSLAPNYNDNWHYKNVSEYGMYSTSTNYKCADKIKNICHICAMDEYRENFAVTDVGKDVGENTVEIFIPGCHSDIGGGYYDGDEEQEIVINKVTEKAEYREIDENGDFRPIQVAEKDVPVSQNQDVSNKNTIEHKETKGIMDYLKENYPAPSGLIDELASSKVVNDVVNKSSGMLNDIRNKSLDTLDYINNSLPQVRGKTNKKNVYMIFPEYKLSDNKNKKWLGLSSLGWIDINWNNPQKALIKIDEKNVPCTIILKDEDEEIKFKRNVKAGYSNISLNMMRTYAENKLKSMFNKLFDSAYIDEEAGEYPIPIDLKNFYDKVVKLMSTGIRLYVHPEESQYKKLRMKYLHFTATDNKNIKNIANPPNHDINGRICRLVYHGDKDDYSINYMYNYPSIDVKKIKDIKISFSNPTLME